MVQFDHRDECDKEAACLTLVQSDATTVSVNYSEKDVQVILRHAFPRLKDVGKKSHCAILFVVTCDMSAVELRRGGDGAQWKKPEGHRGGRPTWLRSQM